MRRLEDIVLNRTPLTLDSAEPVAEAGRRMSERRVGSVLVTGAEGRLVGIFTGRDAVQRMLAQARDAASTPLEDVMTRDPVTLSPHESAVDALRLMWDGGFRHVPVVDGERILGVVSRGDFKDDENRRLEDERELWEHMR